LKASDSGLKKDKEKSATFKKLNRLIFTKENLDNDYICWDIGGKKPTRPKVKFANSKGSDLSGADYRRIIQIKTQLDDMVYKAVLDYVNDEDLCNCDEGFFPRRDRLTGNYYVSYECYYFENDGIRVSVSTHFTEMFCGGAVTIPTEEDYLGLEVSFFVDDNGNIEIDEINSSSI
jgi:hypothetical protein